MIKLMIVTCLLLISASANGKTCEEGFIWGGSSCHASTLQGYVVGVTDGDTIKILDTKKVLHRVRLAHIDAPESRQAFGTVAKQKMSNLCFRKQAMVAVLESDRYGRKIGIVECEQINANESMIGAGLAWVYWQYTPVGNQWGQLEAEARDKKLGLWADKNPLPPWMFRKEKRGHHGK